MRHVISLVVLLGLFAAGAVAQTKYQPVTPKKEQKPLNPADVATLTGRPAPPPSVTALPRKPGDPAAQENGNSPQAAEESDSKQKPLNPADVDILTGKYDRHASPGYRGTPYGLEGLWTVDWMQRRGYTNGDSFFSTGNDSFFSTGSNDNWRNDSWRNDSWRRSQPFFFPHRFDRRFHRPFPLTLLFGRSGSFFFSF